MRIDFLEDKKWLKALTNFHRVTFTDVKMLKSQILNLCII